MGFGGRDCGFWESRSGRKPSSVGVMDGSRIDALEYYAIHYLSFIE